MHASIPVSHGMRTIVSLKWVAGSLFFPDDKHKKHTNSPRVPRGTTCTMPSHTMMFVFLFVLCLRISSSSSSAATPPASRAFMTSADGVSLDLYANTTRVHSPLVVQDVDLLDLVLTLQSELSSARADTTVQLAQQSTIIAQQSTFIAQQSTQLAAVSDVTACSLGPATKEFLAGDGSRLVNPHGTALSHDKSLLYVTDHSPNTAGAIYVWSLESSALVRSFGTPVSGSGNQQFNHATTLALASSSALMFVADWGNNRVQVWNSTAGTYLRTYGAGTAGTTNTQFNGPWGVALNEADNLLFVSDAYNSRVQVWSTSTHSYVRTVGASGAGNGQFSIPTGVAYNPATRILHVADRNNFRIQVWNTTTWSYLRSYGAGVSTASPAGFAEPHQITLNSDGTLLYVADQSNKRISVWSTVSHAFVRVIGSSDGSAPAFGGPIGVAVIQTGSGAAQLLVADYDGGQVLAIRDLAPWQSCVSVTAQQSSLISQLSVFNSSQSTTIAQQGIQLAQQSTLVSQLSAINSSQSTTIAQQSALIAQQSAAIRSTGCGLGPSSFEYFKSDSSRLTNPHGVTLSPDRSLLYVVDYSAGSVYAWSVASGSFVVKYGTLGANNDQFSQPTSVVCSSNSLLYVVDFGNSRIQIWNTTTSTGTYVRTYGSLGSGNNQLNTPWGIALSEIDGLLFISDNGNNRVQVWSTTSHAYVRTLGSPGSGNGQFSFPTGLAYNPSTKVLFVADLQNNRIQLWNTTTWTYIRSYGTSTATASTAGFYAPHALALNSDATLLYVADRLNKRISVWSTVTHSFVRLIGSGGIAPNQPALVGPIGVAVIQSGSDVARVFVTDYDTTKVFQVRDLVPWEQCA